MSHKKLTDARLYTSRAIRDIQHLREEAEAIQPYVRRITYLHYKGQIEQIEASLRNINSQLENTAAEQQPKH